MFQREQEVKIKTMFAYRQKISTPFMTRKTSYFIAMLVALFLPLSVRAETLSKKASRDLPNFYCVNPSYYRGGQPSSSGMEKLAQVGIKTIIDLRQPGERSEGEEELAAKLGMHYVNIPVNNWKAPSTEHVTQFLKLVLD